MERRFVILCHSGCGKTHFDLMIEEGPSLATWQFEFDPAAAAWESAPGEHAGGPGDGPDVAGGPTLRARRLGPHRMAYLDYEGPVSRGRGSVRRIDRGTCLVESSSADLWTVQFVGWRFRGHFQFLRQAGDDWLLARLL